MATSVPSYGRHPVNDQPWPDRLQSLITKAGTDPFASREAESGRVRRDLDVLGQAIGASMVSGTSNDQLAASVLEHACRAGLSLIGTCRVVIERRQSPATSLDPLILGALSALETRAQRLGLIGAVA